MRGLDIFIMRCIPLVFFIYIIVVYMLAWLGIQNIGLEYFMGDSVLFSLSMFLISLSNKKYHCLWNRAMYVEMIVVPLINYVDYKWNLFADAYIFLIFVSSTIVLTIVATVFLSVRHFMKPRIEKIRYESRKR